MTVVFFNYVFNVKSVLRDFRFDRQFVSRCAFLLSHSKDHS